MCILAAVVGSSTQLEGAHGAGGASSGRTKKTAPRSKGGTFHLVSTKNSTKNCKIGKTPRFNTNDKNTFLQTILSPLNTLLECNKREREKKGNVTPQNVVLSFVVISKKAVGQKAARKSKMFSRWGAEAEQ